MKQHMVAMLRTSTALVLLELAAAQGKDGAA